jgi:hypothetical protein
MARTIITTVTDDIDGASDASTISFGLDGIAYSIDLSAKNEKKLRDALAPYIEKASRSRGGSAPRSGAKRNDRDYDIANLREWAAKKGIAVPSRGRIPGSVVEQYRAAGGR